ncbi:hypothetical protein [Bradyrhizobium pachyrhizi]|uniref:hypothetical protein n=1 Tax=Bradyrhizobium pachyrhizi TaxID=280333 RepID=UPI00067ACC83|nr:hypothetical protein [Bradyrhizobium pachyrhizi]
MAATVVYADLKRRALICRWPTLGEGGCFLTPAGELAIAEIGTAHGTSPISPKEISLLKPARRGLYGILDAIDVGAVPDSDVESPSPVSRIDFDIDNVFATGNASKFSKGYQLQIPCRDHRGDHRSTPYEAGNNSDRKDVVPMTSCEG